MNRRLAVVLAAGVVALAAACTDPQAVDPTGMPTTPTATPEASSGPATPTPSASPTPSTSPTPSPSPSPTPAGPHGRLELTGWAQHHPNPTSLELTAVAVDAAGNLLVDIVATNSYHRGQVRLAVFDVQATDDLGNSYEFVPAEGDQEAFELGMEADQRLTGTLAFLGPVSDEATTLDIGFNQSARQDGPVAAPDDSQGQYPKFYFADVPLPGVGLDDQATRDDGQGTATVEAGRTVEPDDWPGIAVTVGRITSDGRTVSITLEIVNQYDRTMEFLNRNPVLLDGHDSNFYYVENTSGTLEERTVTLTPGDEATVTLSWRGNIHPDADSLTLALNNLSRSSQPDVTTSPYIRIDNLPIPGRDGAGG